MKSKLRKLLCTLLALSLLLSIVPVAVSAEEDTFKLCGDGENEEQFFDNLQAAANAAYARDGDEQRIELLHVIDVSAPLSFTAKNGKDLTIDCHGNEIRSNDSWNAAEDPDALIVVTLDGEGDPSNVTLIGANFFSEGESKPEYAVYAEDVDLVLMDARIEGCSGAGVYAKSVNMPVSVLMNNVQIHERGDELEICGVQLSGKNETNKVDLQVYSDGDENGPFTHISFINKGEHDTVTLYAGRFHQNVNVSGWIPNLTMVKDPEGGWYEVIAAEGAVAEINQHRFSNLKDALDALGTEAVLWSNDLFLLQDVEVNTPLTISGTNKEIGIFGNEHKLTAGTDMTGQVLFSVSDTDGGDERDLSVAFRDLTVSAGEASGVTAFSVSDKAFVKLEKVKTEGEGIGSALDIQKASAEIQECGGLGQVNVSNNSDDYCARLFVNDSVLFGAVSVSGNQKVEASFEYSEIGSLNVEGNQHSVWCGCGKYGSDVSDYISKEYGIEKEESSWIVFVDGEKAAFKVETEEGEEFFNDLNRAVNAVKDGGTVEIQREFVTDHAVCMENGKTFTIHGRLWDAPIQVNWEEGCDFNHEGKDAILYVANGTKVTLENVAVSGAYKCRTCIVVERWDEEDDASLTVRDSALFNVHGTVIENRCGSKDAVVIKSGAFENVGMYHDESTDKDVSELAPYLGQYMLFEEEYFESENGEFGYNEEGDNYFHIEGPDPFEGQRYSRCYVATYDKNAPYIALESDEEFADIKAKYSGNTFTGMDKYTVKIQVHNDEGLAAAALQVRYDTSKFSIESTDVHFVQTNKGDDNSAPPVVVEGDHVNLAFVSDENLTVENEAKGNFTLATLDFTVKDGIGEGEAYFELGIVPVEDGDDAGNLCRFDEEGHPEPTFFNLIGLSVRTRYLPGDVNGDGNVSIADIQLLLKKIVGYPFDPEWICAERTNFGKDEFKLAGDVDGNGALNMLDALRLLRFYMNIPGVTIG